MFKAVFDSRFFVEHYYSDDERVLQRTKEELRRTRGRYVSAIVVHEIYQLTLQREGRDTAVLRAGLLEKDFKVVKVDSEIAKSSAELRNKYGLSMADSIIAATALLLKAACFSDDPHFKAIEEIKTKWL